MDEIYTVEETAQRLKVSPKTVYRALEKGELRASRIGRAWRISETDLSEFVEARMQRRPLHYFSVVLDPCEEGGYHVWVPALPGCHSEGDSREEALEHIREAIELHLELDEDIQPPAETARVAI